MLCKYDDPVTGAQLLTHIAARHDTFYALTVYRSRE